MEQLSGVLDGATAVVFIKDVQGRYVFVNRQYERVCGVSAADVLGRTDHELFPQPTADVLRAHDLSVMKAGVPLEWEERIPVTHGRETFLALKFPLRNEDGDIYAVCGIATDITERKRAEQAQQETVARLRSVLASTLDPIVTIDARGVIESVSNSVERVFGWHPSELVGRNVSVLMPEPHRSAHDEYLARYAQTGQTTILGHTRVFNAMHKTGSLVPIELSISRVDVPGRNEPLFTGIIHDIGERVRAEEELRAHREHLEDLVAQRTAQLESTHEQLRMADRLASIGTLAAGLGHDMNNVLLPVRCRLDALEQQELPDSARDQLPALRRSLDYLQQLSDGLHLFALDPSDPEAAASLTDLRTWWDQVGPLLLRAVPKHAVVDVELPDGLPPVAVASHRLTQAVLNLVVNAGAAVAEGGRVRIWATPFQDRRFVRFGVTDDGHGMSADVKRRALEPFFTTKRRGMGTGLGLSLVHGVAQSAGGTVEIDSEPGCGTTVAMVLPAVEPHDGESVATVDVPALAAITVNDPHLGTLISSMVAGARFEVQLSAPGPTAACDLWFTDPSEHLLPAAGRFCGQPGRQLVICGPATSDWLSLKALLIRDVTDLDQIRQAMELAIRRIQERAAP